MAITVVIPIAVSGDSPLVVGALSGDGAGHLIPTPVRRERLGKLSRRQLAQEAAKVLDQADSVDCQVTTGQYCNGVYTVACTYLFADQMTPR